MASIKVGVGHSTLPDSRQAGQQAAEEALRSSGHPILTFLFTTDPYNQRAVWEAVKAVVGPSRLVGFCAGGVIKGNLVSRRAVGVLTLGGKGLRVATSLQRGLREDPYAAGCAAGEELLLSGIEKGTVFVFTGGSGADVSEAVRGLYNTMGADFIYVGGRTKDKAYQFTEAALEIDALVVALLDGMAIGTAIGHGWRPKDEPLVVTNARGEKVLELDGRAAFETYSSRLGGIPEGRFAEWRMRCPLGFPDIWGNYLKRTFELESGWQHRVHRRCSQGSCGLHNEL